MVIQWYPGHMTKSKRMMLNAVSVVDIVIELLDARIPYSSRNPDINKLAAGKRRIIVLNKADLAEPRTTTLWEAYFKEEGYGVVSMDSLSSKGVSKVADAARLLMRDKVARQRERGRLNTPIRAMIAGIPNVGKSTFINQLSGRGGAVTGDRPGVTRGRQWIKVGKDFDLLDTPGVLWPKFEDESVGLKLAVTGAIADDVLDSVTLSEALIEMLGDLKPEALTERYRLAAETAAYKTPRERLTLIGEARGFKMRGGEIDCLRTAQMVLDEFRGGKLGRISLEHPAPVSTDPPQN